MFFSNSENRQSASESLRGCRENRRPAVLNRQSPRENQESFLEMLLPSAENVRAMDRSTKVVKLNIKAKVDTKSLAQNKKKNISRQIRHFT